MKVIICGSSQWAYDSLVKDEILQLRAESYKTGKKLLVIHGGESGPENYAQVVCRKNGIDTIVQEAVKVRGDNAYYRRNDIMLKYHDPDLVVGFAPVIGECSVVVDMLERARSMDIETKVFDQESIYRPKRLECQSEP